MKRTIRNICLIIVASLVCSLAGAPPAAGRVYFDINAPELRKVPMAVPYFVNSKQPGTVDDAGRKMAAVLSKGLDFHGFISILPPGSYGGMQSADWQALGVDFAVLGQYYFTGKEMVVELRLFNVIEGQMILGKRYRGAPERQSAMVLKFCDEVIFQLTGESGVCLSKIAFVSDTSGYKEVYVADVLGENVRQVTRHKNLTVSPRFSPDGRQLAYTSYHPGEPHLYVTDLAQNKSTKAISRRRGLNLGPAWSPDGKTMIITLSTDGNPDLYLINTKGDILRRLTANAGINVSASWSPDGRQIAFVSDRSGNPQVYIMDLRTGRINRITYLGNDNTEPSWSPKGDWIAYAGLYEGEYQIFKIRPEGGSPVRVTTTAGNHESPNWSPDGRQIVFTRQLNKELKINAIFANGFGMRPLFNVKGNQSSPQWSSRLDL